MFAESRTPPQVTDSHPVDCCCSTKQSPLGTEGLYGSVGLVHRSCGPVEGRLRFFPRPPDRCQVLPGKITAQGWALAPIALATRPQGAPFTVILGGERMPGAWRTARPALAGAVIAGAYGGDRLPCGCGASARRRRARRASARKGAAGRRPRRRPAPFPGRAPRETRRRFCDFSRWCCVSRQELGRCQARWRRRRRALDYKQMITTAWQLGSKHATGDPRFRQWAHMLGYGGHFLTKSRRYSVTFGQLRVARTNHRRAERHPDGRTRALGTPAR